VTPVAPPRFTRTPHLVDLVAETERLATLVADAPDAARDALAVRTADDAVLATLQLDGSPLTQLPDPSLAAPETTGAPESAADQVGAAAPPGRPGTWLDAMGALRGDLDDRVAALEAAGARAALDSRDLDGPLLADPVPTLAELHRRLTRGLLDEPGVPRRSDQAVHDASVGRVLYFPLEPAGIPAALADLGAWVASHGSREHGLVVSGVVHLELLRLHPYEAANGRLARAAARSVLRARGLDPDGLAAPEVVLADDPLGYHEEVARTLRRRDATIWLERWAETVADGLRMAARRLDRLVPALPDRAVRFVAGRADPAFTLTDYRAEAEVGAEQARTDLRALQDAGQVRRVPGTRGLRYLVVDRG
jgi:hypothetical protein